MHGEKKRRRLTGGQSKKSATGRGVGAVEGKGRCGRWLTVCYNEE